MANRLSSKFIQKGNNDMNNPLYGEDRRLRWRNHTVIRFWGKAISKNSFSKWDGAIVRIGTREPSFPYNHLERAMLYRAQVGFFDTGRLFYCSFFGSPSLSSQECVSNKTGGEVRVY